MAETIGEMNTTMNILMHLFQSDLFVAQNLAYEYPTLVPADVAAIIHSRCLK